MSKAADMADQASEAIRALNHATIFGDDLAVTDVYDTLAALSALSQRLPQTFSQMSDVLEAHLAAGRLGVDDIGVYRHASSAVSAARTALAAAAAAAEAMDRAVHDAHQAAARLKPVEPRLRALPGPGREP
jgi:pantothenate kinase